MEASIVNKVKSAGLDTKRGRALRATLYKVSMTATTSLIFPIALAALAVQTPALKSDAAALNAQMVAAFQRDPSAVSAFYTDTAAIIGGGQRAQGRAAIDEYWKGATMFASWSLETIDAGGHPDAPWQYGRSVLQGRSGRSMETYFVGLLRRQPGGELKFQVDVFTRGKGEGGADEAGRALQAYLSAVERADAAALERILDDQFVIVSSGGARDKAREISDLVPQSGARVEYFRSDDTRTRGFGALAVSTGILRWRFGGRDIERNHSTVLIKRGEEWKLLAQQVTPVPR
jgi:ketosteroid isomerase-like protein